MVGYAFQTLVLILPFVIRSVILLLLEFVL